MQRTIRITRCRLCNSKDLKKTFSLGNLCINDFIKKGAKVKKAPLTMVLCKGCQLAQLQHSAPQEIMYARHYWYKSGISEVIKDDLAEIARKGIMLAEARTGDIFLDIGANDGTLLSNVPEDMIAIGCEPADNLKYELAKEADFVIDEFWAYKHYRLISKMFLQDKRAKVITAIGMFYDTDDPNQFIKDVAKSLDKEGVFIAQLMTLAPMLQKNDISNICHEHLEYYSYKNLVRLFEKNGLEIFKVEENGINGGSYRLFARHLDGGSIAYPEPDLDLKSFEERFQANAMKTVEFIEREVKKGKKVYGYGASTKGNTILQYYGLNSKLITGIADRNNEKWGKFTVGTNIPIVSEERARVEADYFFVLPYAFLKTFYDREHMWRKGGGQFIVSIPEFKIIK